MRGYVLRLLGMLVAFVAAIYAMNWAVDPFGYNGTRLVEYDRRLVSYELGRNAYKISRFRQWEGDTAFFGDSTVNMIDAEKVAPDLAAQVFNFGVGGQTLFDTIDAVRYAVATKPLRHVYIGVPFRHFDDRSSARVFAENAEAIRSPLRANLALKTTEASVAAIGHIARITSKTPRDPDAIASTRAMQSRLEGMRSKYAARSAPETLIPAFEALLCELRAEGIDVTLFTPPSSLAAREEALVHGEAYRRFKDWVTGLGRHVDYDTGAGLSENMDNFYDHNHVKPAAGEVLLRDLLSDAPQLGKVSEGTPEC